MGIPQTIQFASLGMADSLILMVLALVVFGPRRLPQIGRQIGKLMYEFRKASNDFKFQMEEELRNAEEADRRKKEEERLKALSLAAPAPDASVPDTPAADTPASGSSTAEAGTTAPVASPYPWESVYPSVAAPATEAQPEDSTLQIQPPSTGETVAATPLKRTRRKGSAKQPATGDTLASAPADTPATEPQFHTAAEQAWKEADEAVAPPTEASGPQIQPPSTGEVVAAAPPRSVRRKRTPKPPAAETATAATEQPAPPSEPTPTDAPASEKSGTVPEQVNG
jgi:sec-independent protein translocase protein TatB